MTLYGYARVSTKGQNLVSQIDALTKAGVAKTNLYQEKISGAERTRQSLQSLLDTTKDGDTIVVARLDRLGRSLADLIKIIEDLRARGIHFVSLAEQIDTRTAIGELFFHISGAFAQYERSLIKERVKAGMQARMAEGVKMGPKEKMTPEQAVLARKLIESGTHVKEVAAGFNVHPKTIYRSIDRLAPQNSL
ncbi:recombinase family protein [Rhizobiaceae bacterium CRRU44]|uniref:Recombinase family protein n=1 Tax=Ferranicluibacter rubi TaxID=2715133 RepID=A0AA43ZL05_9HYPH|nr:recombinase family protein [Ferranicluibacter rubi]NHT78960.1 recombinase family protein [Ferranicluibacter rubi]